MEEVEIAKWFTEMGIGGAFAALLFFFYRKDVKQYTDLWQKQAELNHAQTNAMMSLVERNMVTITANTEVLKALHHRIDRLDVLRFMDEDGGGGPEGKKN